MGARRAVLLPTIEFFLPLLLPSKAVSLVAGTFPEVEIEEPEVEEPFAKGARSSHTTHSIASITQSTSSADHLSIIRDIVGRVGVNFEFAETGDKI